MRIIFFGTPEPAAEILEGLLKAKQNVVAAITRPDRPKGRGLVKEASPVALISEKYGIKTLKPEKLISAEFQSELNSFECDIAVVVAYGKIIPPEFLKLPKYGFINVHASLLPKYRGASPIQAALLNGEKETGVTIMRLDEGLDTGGIIEQATVKIEEDDDCKTLSDKLFRIGKGLLLKVLDDLEKGTAKKTPQDNSKASYAPLIRKEEGLIDFGGSAGEINNKVRAFTGWPGAFTFYKGKKIKFLKAEVIEEASAADDAGTVKELIKNRGFVISCAKGLLLVKVVQPENSKVMTASEFVRGYRTVLGDKFGM